MRMSQTEGQSASSCGHGAPGRPGVRGGGDTVVRTTAAAEGRETGLPPAVASAAPTPSP